MVLMNASKRARNQASIVNRTDTCGGNKKAGTAPRVGIYLDNNVKLTRAPQNNPKVCVPNRTVQTQVIGYQATRTGRLG